jgi:hypothetical protein
MKPMNIKKTQKTTLFLRVIYMKKKKVSKEERLKLQRQQLSDNYGKAFQVKSVEERFRQKIVREAKSIRFYGNN